MVDKTICTEMLVQMVSTEGTIIVQLIETLSISSWIPLLHHACVITRIELKRLLAYIHILTPAAALVMVLMRWYV